VFLLRYLRPNSIHQQKYPRTTIMAHKNVTHHDTNAPDEIDPSVLSRGQVIQLVIDLRWQFGEQWAKTDHERELIAIHCDTTEHEREAITHVNHQFLTQIKVLREAQHDSLSWAPGRPRWTPPPRLIYWPKGKLSSFYFDDYKPYEVIRY